MPKRTKVSLGPEAIDSVREVSNKLGIGLGATADKLIAMGASRWAALRRYSEKRDSPSKPKTDTS